MQTRRTIAAILVAMLFIGMIFVPAVGAQGADNNKILLNTNQPETQYIVDAAKDTGVVPKEGPEKLSKPLGFSGNYTFNIPKGTTVVHTKDGVTEIYDQSGNLWKRFPHEKVDNVSTLYGPQKATKVYELPSDSSVQRASRGEVDVYGPSGKLILRVVDEEKPESIPAFNGWIETAKYTYDTNINWFYAEWTVPTDPISNWIDDDVVYLFPSIQAPGSSSWSGRYTIIQPVLEHNQNGIWPGNPITGSAWIVDEFNNYYRSDPINVNVGDSIKGSMSWDGSKWWITFNDQTTGGNTYLTTNLQGTTQQRLDTALEGYNLETTSDLWGTTDFVNMAFERNGQTITIDWTPYVDPNAQNQFQGLGVDDFGSSHTRLRTGR